MGEDIKEGDEGRDDRGDGRVEEVVGGDEEIEEEMGERWEKGWRWARRWRWERSWISQACS